MIDLQVSTAGVETVNCFPVPERDCLIYAMSSVRLTSVSALVYIVMSVLVKTTEGTTCRANAMLEKAVEGGLKPWKLYYRCVMLRSGI
jgi:hypothetical protein